MQHQNQKLPPSTGTLLGPGGGPAILRGSFSVCSVVFNGRVLTFFEETGRREWRARTEFFLHHPLICFEVLPNAALLISELLPPLQDSRRNPRDTCRLRCQRRSSQRQRRSASFSSGLCEPFRGRAGCYTARLSTCGQQALLSIDGRRCEFILVVSSAAYKGLLSTRTDWPLFLELSSHRRD